MDIHLSVKCSLDGYLSESTGENLLKSSAEDQTDIQVERIGFGAVLVGAGTLRSENPCLNVGDPTMIEARRKEGLPPHLTRITLTRTGELDRRLNFFNDDGARKIVLCPEARSKVLQLKFGDLVEVVGLPDPINASGIARKLCDIGLTSVLIEGGAHMLSMFLEEGLFNRLRLALVPIILGCRGDLKISGFPSPSKMDRLQIYSSRQLGDTIAIDYGPAPNVNFAEQDNVV